MRILKKVNFSFIFSLSSLVIVHRSFPEQVSKFLHSELANFLSQEKSDALTALNEEISNEIKEALPDLEAAERQIKVLDKKDLVEVRVLNKPPELVFQVMAAICLLLNVK